jgi:ABC-2 type transport system ATP-binding protein
MLKQGRVVALERTSDLLRSATAQVLRLKLDGELPAALKAIARVTGRIVQLPVHNAIEIENHLAAIRSAGLVAEDVEIRQADLEDVFLEVMNRNQPQVQGVAA